MRIGKCMICGDTTGFCSCPVYAVEDVKLIESIRIKLGRMWWKFYTHVIKRCPDCKHRLSFGRGYPYCGNCNGN